ncbi:hypothetical protein H181DRAFT_03704 [Streptomyces sp. WMMB 714]|jgi:DnaJ-class molecular chaperone|nr:hypothetical protein H181DRAFT_03704 [Streptomyces sp. WMMB 714]
MTAVPPPYRCTSCSGTGKGQTVMNGRGCYVESCESCKGSGRVTQVLRRPDRPGLPPGTPGSGQAGAELLEE